MNKVADRVRIINGDLLTCIRGRVDVVVANLTSFGITSLCSRIANYLHASGTFIASGIPSDKSVEVAQAVRDAGLRVERVREREGWVALAARFCPE